MVDKEKPARKPGVSLERFDTLFSSIRDLILLARKTAVRNVDTLQVLTSFEIGRRIVEHEQKGSQRAAYGKLVLQTLSEKLTAEFGGGFSKRNLEYMRRFYLAYRERPEHLARTPFGKPRGAQTDYRNEHSLQIAQMPSAQLVAVFPLSWSQYIFLIGIRNDGERRFYEMEAAQNSWTLPELKRQYDSGLYERLILSRDRKGIRKLAREGQTVAKPQDLLKEPYVLEFLGLDEKTAYTESDLETAIIDKLEHFLLELGKGFLFEARQKRFTFDTDHFFVDLVFFNRLLRCYVLIDLKIGKLTHQDLGQMQMYVNYFDRHVKTKAEHPTVGIILCKKKHDALVEITLPKNANIHAKEYQLYLPSKEELKRKLVEWLQEQERRA